MKAEDDSTRQSHFPGSMSREQDYQESTAGKKSYYEVNCTQTACYEAGRNLLQGLIKRH